MAMQEHSGSAVRTIALAFIGGAILGGAAGLLLAPKTGRETRKELKQYANKVSKEVTDVAQRTKAGFEAAVEKGRSLLESKAA
jgi:gas vesicle protein